MGPYGGGACVVLSGEAGIGKTSLLRAFVQGLPTGTTVLYGGCEALFTPRPLGPLIDLASHFPPSVEHALHQGGTYNNVFPGLIRTLAQGPRKRVLVIEDMHWADVGTMDFVRFLGRRIHELPLLLVLSYRGEALDLSHPLQHVLGDLPAAVTTRLELQPLSLAAVSQLADLAPGAAQALYSASLGNPFYVTELLAAGGASIPPSVRDAVLATLARLSSEARELACAVSLFPKSVTLERLEAMGALHAANRDAVNECLRAGMLVAEDLVLAFRHEIVRDVVHEAMPGHARRQAHAAAFQTWRPAGRRRRHSAPDAPRRGRRAHRRGERAGPRSSTARGRDRGPP